MKNTYILLLAIIIISSCKEEIPIIDEPAPQHQNHTTINEYFPNTIGTSWTYSVTDNYAHTHRKMTIIITDTLRHLDGTKLYKWSIDGDKDFWFIANCNDTLYRYATLENSTRNLLLILPFTVGNYWLNPSISGYGYDTIRVLSKTEVSVPYGNYTQSFIVEDRNYGIDTRGRTTYSIVPIIGIVNLHTKTGGTIMDDYEWKLTDCHIVPKIITKEK